MRPCLAAPLYLIEILHQTTTAGNGYPVAALLYLIEILHQTTTMQKQSELSYGCILSKFYIKPQQSSNPSSWWKVVSYRNSTSNHNLRKVRRLFASLYLIEILHQTTTASASNITGHALYLIEILHQTTTSGLILIDKVLLTGCLPL